MHIKNHLEEFETIRLGIFNILNFPFAVREISNNLLMFH